MSVDVSISVEPRMNPGSISAALGDVLFSYDPCNIPLINSSTTLAASQLVRLAASDNSSLSEICEGTAEAIRSFINASDVSVKSCEVQPFPPPASSSSSSSPLIGLVVIPIIIVALIAVYVYYRRRRAGSVVDEEGKAMSVGSGDGGKSQSDEADLECNVSCSNVQKEELHYSPLHTSPVHRTTPSRDGDKRESMREDIPTPQTLFEVALVRASTSLQSLSQSYDGLGEQEDDLSYQAPVPTTAPIPTDNPLFTCIDGEGSFLALPTSSLDDNEEEEEEEEEDVPYRASDLGSSPRSCNPLFTAAATDLQQAPSADPSLQPVSFSLEILVEDESDDDDDLFSFQAPVPHQIYTPPSDNPLFVEVQPDEMVVNDKAEPSTSCKEDKKSKQSTFPQPQWKR